MWYWHTDRYLYLQTKGLSSQGYGFSSSHVWMWELDCEESWVPMNWCFWTVVLENTLERPLDYKEIHPVHSKGDESWVFFGRTDAKAETPVLCHLMWGVDSLERLWCWEGLEAGGERDNRGWDGWMASLTPRTWLLVNSGSWWWTGRPGVRKFLGLQRVGHDWATELNWKLKPLVHQRISSGEQRDKTTKKTAENIHNSYICKRLLQKIYKNLQLNHNEKTI